MPMRDNLHYLLASVALLLCGAAYFIVKDSSDHLTTQMPATGSQVHVHADLMLTIDGERVDLSDDAYQSSAENALHPDLHLHDNEGDILHRHAPDVTLGDFLDSIGISYESGCLARNAQETSCSDANHVLRLYVNGTHVPGIFDYVIQDEDRLLVYDGPDDQSVIETLVDTVSDRACIYSGTCPSRGIPPPESCGLTCDI